MLEDFDPATRPDIVPVVGIRCFAGFDAKEIADVPQVGERTVERQWQKARAFLVRGARGGRRRD
jgi:hypothetical protein